MSVMVQPKSFAKATTTIVAVILIVAAIWLRNQPPGPNAVSRPSEASKPAAHYDLSRDEQLGGHTLQRHVGRTDQQLLERLAQQPSISAASTYTDRAIAEQTVATALVREPGRIESWLDRSDSHPNLALHFRGKEQIGRSIRRGERIAQPAYDATIVLRWDGDHQYHVLTSYPEPNRDR